MKDKLNIAIFNTASLPIPPFKGYGGTQRGVHDFLIHMNQKGHRLHLFGPGDCNVSELENVVLHSYIKNSIWAPENNLPFEIKKKQEVYHYKECIKELEKIDKNEKIDIINIRFDDAWLEEVVNKFGKERIVYGLHNIRDKSKIDLVERLGIKCVAHCRNHKKQHENFSNIQIITYGINVKAYPFSSHTLISSEESLSLDILKRLKERNEDYLIIIGAISRNKGQKTCIELSKRTNNNLIIAGTPQDRTSTKNQTYFEEEIEPQINNENIIYFGNANEEQKKELLKYAKGFLFLSGYEDTTWNEPFGRAPVEALSCGTPVIGFRKGSMEEIIYDSFNGYLFDDLDEAVNQINSLNDIERKNCRSTALKKFDSKRVADEYEKLFYEIVNKKSNGPTRI